MANKVQAKVDVKTVEFLLDLPEDFSMTGITMDGDKVIVEFETSLEIPDEVTMQYQTDEFGNIALVGFE